MFIQRLQECSQLLQMQETIEPIGENDSNIHVQRKDIT